MTYEQLYEEQLKLEKEAQDVKQRKEFLDIHKAIEQDRILDTRQGSAIMKVYFEPIRKKMEEYLRTEYLGHTGKTQRYIKMLCNDDSSILAYITIHTLFRTLSINGNPVKVVALTRRIISRLKVNYEYLETIKTKPKLIAYLGSEYRRASARRKKDLLEKHLVHGGASNQSEEVRAGAIILDLVLKSEGNFITISKMWNKRNDRHSTFYCKFDDEVSDVLKDMTYISPLMAMYPPMIIPPKDWTGLKEGGYLDVDFPFIKVKGKKVLRILENEDFTKPMRAINKLQKTAWRVNTRISNIIYDIYESNMIDPRSPPTLPRLYGDIPTSIPTKLEDLIEPIGEYKETYTPEEKKRWAIWNRKREHIKIGLDGEVNRRYQYLLTMGVVEKMIDYDRFYYVYQLDYRGRVYPITDFFNPQSKGYVKAMLEFADGHYLDDKGIYWLKIHLANCYGLDKAPFEERIKWAEDNRSMILRAATNPMGMLSYWTESDSPYEFLAACMAWEDHIQGKKVHLPIQLDAVNSGIQMYSGLLRDREGAKATCVIGDVRSDLYEEVATRVEKKLSEGKYPAYVTYIDKEGIENVITTKVEADSLKGNFTRSMTKRNVMTIPYSVSLRGMKMQNWDVMDDYKLKGKVFWKGDDWVVNYLWTTLTHESVYEIVKGARAGQAYLKEVVGKLKEPALWHTPIYNLPVLQVVNKEEITRVKTILGTLQLRKVVEGIKRQKQLASVAANYIHSIDATILMYTVDNIDGDIGTIHDCFLVHPNKGEEVRDKYKEGYVKVMRADPLKMFSEELDPAGEVEIPYVGDLDLNEVYDSRYIIS